MVNRNEMPKPINQPYGVRRPRVMALILSVTEAKVWPGPMIGTRVVSAGLSGLFVLISYSTLVLHSHCLLNLCPPGSAGILACWTLDSGRFERRLRLAKAKQAGSLRSQ